MALQLRTLTTFAAPSDIPERAPMPNDAVGYVDFTANLHMTRTGAAVANDSALVFSRDNTPRTGFYYGRADLEKGAHTMWDRIEYAPDGSPLGLLVEDVWNQQLVDVVRSDLTQGTATGATVAVSVTSTDAWRRWYSITPSGAGEASLALATASIAVNEYVYVHFDVRGSGIVQLGMRNADVTGYANFNLATGEAVASDSAIVAQAQARADGSWTVVARFRKTTAEAGQPYIASVASMSTGRLGASGAAFEARAPRVEKINNAGMPARSYYDAFTHAADVITPVSSLFDLAGDFSVVFRARSGWFASRTAAALLFFSNTATSGAELRFDGSNGLIVRQTSGSVIVASDPEIRWTPETVYRVGVSRRGSLIDVVVNGRVVSFDGGTAVADAKPVLFGSAATTGANSWSGHLQKCIWWAEGRKASDLAALVSRWL